MSASGDGTASEGQSTREIAELVRSIAVVMHQTDVSELDLDLGSLKLRLRRLPGNWNSTSDQGDRFDTSPVRAASDEHVITAPMIGTFYSSPTPGAPPFVTIGDAVQIGQPVGIIEAMKIMNEISADRSGVVEAILVGSGQAVEYGTPLIQLAVGMDSGT